MEKQFSSDPKEREKALTEATCRPPKDNWGRLQVEVHKVKSLSKFSLRHETNFSYLPINGTKNQREALERDDLKVFIRTFSQISFHHSTSEFVQYSDMLIHHLISAEIYSVKLLLRNVPYFDSPFWKTCFIFSQDQLVVLLHLGTK
jgi:hypothetical protein